MRKLADDEDDDLYTDLTEQQERILDYIEDRIAGGLPPTRAEIAKHFGFRSDNAAEGHVKALARKGRLVLVRMISRGIRLVPL